MSVRRLLRAIVCVGIALSLSGCEAAPAPSDGGDGSTVAQEDGQQTQNDDDSAEQSQSGTPSSESTEESSTEDVLDTDDDLFAACWLLSEGEAGWDDNDCQSQDFDSSGTVNATDLGLLAGAPNR